VLVLGPGTFGGAGDFRLVARDIVMPLFAFGTEFTDGRVVDAARRFARTSKVPRASFAQATRFTHLDPLTASPGKNHFLRTVVPFLKRVR
jgi:hypothetical protein